ncbi:hypothetical protein AG1IA_02652 [Rhizoctonia solani AG-1 IA]|uniref:Uncharacterized protein n=1 Tax=Thanatephorus cucumeris (strain AG1-IA) TaxID=983506 RepID=L8WZ25_THACA|nr:hypothetical protein AG1IA_02652 [Rhizoctonia solani AG-1 IA]
MHTLITLRCRTLFGLEIYSKSSSRHRNFASCVAGSRLRPPTFVRITGQSVPKKDMSATPSSIQKATENRVFKRIDGSNVYVSYPNDASKGDDAGRGQAKAPP